MNISIAVKLDDKHIFEIEKLDAHINLYNSREALMESNELAYVDAIISGQEIMQIDFLERCKRLKWVHVNHVGIEKMPMDYFGKRHVMVTNARGAAGQPISESVINMMLMLARKSMFSFRNQLKHLWKGPEGVINLYGKIVGILGTGNIGSESAKRIKAFDTKIIGLNRKGEPVEYFDRVYPVDDLNEFLSQCDFIICTLPSTKETIRLIDEEQFKLIKPTSYIINVSRANIFNEEILYYYLKNNKIAGAALDVFLDELEYGYLLKESPLWDLENVIITPHMAAWGDQWNARSNDIIVHNIKYFCEGKFDKMLNIRDYAKGY